MTGYIEESLSLQNKGSDEEDFHISTPNKNNKYDRCLDCSVKHMLWKHRVARALSIVRN